MGGIEIGPDAFPNDALIYVDFSFCHSGVFGIQMNLRVFELQIRSQSMFKSSRVKSNTWPDTHLSGDEFHPGLGRKDMFC